jgi:hypothetical protein
VVIELGDLYRIAGITQFKELHPLDDPATFHVQAGYDSFGKHGYAHAYAKAETISRKHLRTHGRRRSYLFLPVTCNCFVVIYQTRLSYWTYRLKQIDAHHYSRRINR